METIFRRRNSTTKLRTNEIENQRKQKIKTLKPGTSKRAILELALLKTMAGNWKDMVKRPTNPLQWATELTAGVNKLTYSKPYYHNPH